MLVNCNKYHGSWSMVMLCMATHPKLPQCTLTKCMYMYYLLTQFSKKYYVVNFIETVGKKIRRETIFKKININQTIITIT